MQRIGIANALILFSLLTALPGAAADLRCKHAVKPRGEETASKVPYPRDSNPYYEFFYQPEFISGKYADLFIDDPRTAKSAAENDFRAGPRTTNRGVKVNRVIGAWMPRQFHREMGGAFMLSQMAGWSVKDRQNKRARQAYTSARDVYFRVYDEADAFEDGDLQDRFVARLASISGPRDLVGDGSGAGTARLKADLAIFLQDRIRVAEQENKKYIALTTAKHLAFTLYACEVERVVRYLVPLGSKKATRVIGNQSLDSEPHRMIGSLLVYDAPGSRSLVANMLAESAVDVAQLIKKKGSEDKGVRARTYQLGKLLAHADVGVWVHLRKAKQEKASAEHGAWIVRLFLSGVDRLTGGASTAFTTPMRKGVDWLEKKEVAAAVRAEKATYQQIRGKMVDAAVAALKAELDYDYTVGESDNILAGVETFERNLIEGRDQALRAFEADGVSIPGWMGI